MDKKTLKNNILNFDNLGLIRWYKGDPVVTLNDFEKITGIDLIELGPFFKLEYFTGGIDWNVLGQGELRKEFEKINNVKYEGETLTFMYLSGFIKALKIINEMKTNRKIDYRKEIN